MVSRLKRAISLNFSNFHIFAVARAILQHLACGGNRLIKRPSRRISPPPKGCFHFSLSAFQLFSFLILPGVNLCAEATSWQVQGASYRATIQLQTPPKVADTGILIDLPEFGQTRADMGNLVLVDETGAPQPLAKVWRGEGRHLLLLAKEMKPGKNYTVYFGGSPAIDSPNWAPKLSLMMETRLLPPGTKYDTWANMQKAWTSATETDGAGFVEWIYHGSNPFGIGVNFLTHYTGWIETNGLTNIFLYTLSSDSSYVLVDGRFEFDWPGVHSPWATPKTVHGKEVACSPGFAKIDYYQAKGSTEADAAMVLGWKKDNKLQAIPPDAWLHPGTSTIKNIEEIHSLPFPTLKAEALSYIGYGRQWFYEMKYSPAEKLPDGWTVEWEFEDGAQATGTECRRVVVGSKAWNVTLKLKHDLTELRGIKRVAYPESVHAASINDTGDVARYLALLAQEKPELLSKDSLDACLMFLLDFGSNEETAGFAEAWLKKNPEPHGRLWIQAQSIRLRALAARDAGKALAELSLTEPQIRKKFQQELDLLELDLVVYFLRDARTEETAKRIAFQYPNSETERIAKIRNGDYFRLTEQYKKAVAQYQEIQKMIVDESAGRKLPAQDQAYSITIKNLISKNLRSETLDALHEWELRHPMAKFDSDYLLLEGRALNAFGRWTEALAELDSFKKIQHDSPFLIDADFYRAVALEGLGRKEEARKIWHGITTSYPKHELAAQSKQLAEKP